MINVDCQKLIDACLFVNMMWSCPLQVGLSIFFLYNTIGVAVFVGKNKKILKTKSEIRYTTKILKLTSDK